jgi:hypothetical protein
MLPEAVVEHRGPRLRFSRQAGLLKRHPSAPPLQPINWPKNTVTPPRADVIDSPAPIIEEPDSIQFAQRDSWKKSQPFECWHRP